MPKQINPTKDVRADDTIIAFMGPTTVLLELVKAFDRDRRAGNTLKSVTSQIEALTVTHPFDEKKRVILVDTPGFDHTTKSDMQILQMISEWLQNTYKTDVRLSGLIYLHRITDNRMAGSPYKNLRMFGELCGDVAMNQVFLVSTMWGRIKPVIGEARETELKTKFWKPLVDRGSTVERLSVATGDEAWRIVKMLIESHEQKPKRGIVLLQEEMVDLGIKLNETQAGRTLYTSLQKQLADQKDALKTLLAQVERSSDPGLSKELKKEYDKIEADFQKTFEEAKKSKVSIGTKIAGIFGGKKAPAKDVKIGEDLPNSPSSAEYLPKIIAVMGSTGAGKSTFIKAATGTDDGTLPSLMDNIILVETPGLDDAHEGDVQILEGIEKWLQDTCPSGIRLFRILFLHNIMDQRVTTNTILLNFDLFQNLCNSSVLPSIILVTTYWDQFSAKNGFEGGAHEQQLRNKYWRPLLNNGSKMLRFENTCTSAWNIIKSFPNNVEVKEEGKKKII